MYFWEWETTFDKSATKTQIMWAKKVILAQLVTDLLNTTFTEVMFLSLLCITINI